MKLAVVIPTLNEEGSLPALFASLAAQSFSANRVIVADGGSGDGTETEARRHGAEIMVIPGRGRGGQIAVALAGVTEDVILIAHADMLLPPNALEAIRSYMTQHPRCPGGCLGHTFARRTLGLRLVEWYDCLRARRGMSYGDQGQFFRREALAVAGGFPDQPIMEDVELSARLQRLGVPVYLDVPVTVSARRFEKLGLARVVWKNWRLRRWYRREGLAGCLAIYRAYYENLPTGPRSR